MSEAMFVLQSRSVEQPREEEMVIDSEKKNEPLHRTWSTIQYAVACRKEEERIFALYNMWFWKQFPRCWRLAQESCKFEDAAAAAAGVVSVGWVGR
jgi:hypothetical protein